MIEGAAMIRFLPLVGARNTIEADYKFQCAPLEEFGYESSYDFTNFVTISGGEFDRRYGRKLRTLSFDTLLTDEDGASWATSLSDLGEVGSTPTSNDLVASLLAIADEGQVFEMLVSSVALWELMGAAEAISQFESGTRLQMYATVRSVRVTEKAGEPGTKYLSVQCVEHRQPVLTSGTRPGSNPKTHDKTVLTMQYGSNKKWKIAVSPLTSSVNKDIQHAVKIKRVTLARLGLAIYGKDYKKRLSDVLKANKGLGSKWGKDTPLEKNKYFKTHKKHTITFPK